MSFDLIIYVTDVLGLRMFCSLLPSIKMVHKILTLCIKEKS